MTIQPTLVLDENDLKPFMEEFRKVMKVKEDTRFSISGLVPVAIPEYIDGYSTGRNLWSIEVKGEFVSLTASEKAEQM